MTPKFDDPRAARRWNDYFAAIDRLLADPRGRPSALRSELENHLAESIASIDIGLAEDDRVALAIARTGTPQEVAGGGEFRRTLGSRTGIWLGKAACGTGRGLGLAVAALFAAMAVAKPLWSDHVGLFDAGDGQWSAGIVAAPGGRELLGLWVIPIGLALAAMITLLLTKSMRVAKARGDERV